jgi:hypothetical protein
MRGLALRNGLRRGVRADVGLLEVLATDGEKGGGTPEWEIALPPRGARRNAE